VSKVIGDIENEVVAATFDLKEQVACFPDFQTNLTVAQTESQRRRQWHKSCDCLGFVPSHQRMRSASVKKRPQHCLALIAFNFNVLDDDAHSFHSFG
jgi:hypothetical protein